MKTMEEYAAAYQKKHRGKGKISNVKDYSFEFTTLPRKESEKEKVYTVMLSYFWQHKDYN